MILGFKPQFEEKILTKKKKTTIREDKKNRWKVGMKIHFATGVRTKNYRKFAEGIVQSIDTISIKYIDALFTRPTEITYKGKTFSVFVNFYPLSEQQIIDLIEYEGFDSFDDFFAFFPNDFKGKLIRWERESFTPNQDLLYSSWIKDCENDISKLNQQIEMVNNSFLSPFRKEFERRIISRQLRKRQRELDVLMEKIKNIISDETTR